MAADNSVKNSNAVQMLVDAGIGESYARKLVKGLGDGPVLDDSRSAIDVVRDAIDSWSAELDAGASVGTGILCKWVEQRRSLSAAGAARRRKLATAPAAPLSREEQIKAYLPNSPYHRTQLERKVWAEREAAEEAKLRGLPEDDFNRLKERALAHFKNGWSFMSRSVEKNGSDPFKSPALKVAMLADFSLGYGG